MNELSPANSTRSVFQFTLNQDNWMSGCSAKEAAKLALCDAAGGCITGAIIGQFPSTLAGCLGGALGNAASLGCKWFFGIALPPTKCAIFDAAVSTILGCLGGAAASAGDPELNLILSLLGITEQELSTLCGIVLPHMEKKHVALR